MESELLGSLGRVLVFATVGCVTVGLIALVVWAIARYVISALNRLLDE